MQRASVILTVTVSSLIVAAVGTTGCTSVDDDVIDDPTTEPIERGYELLASVKTDGGGVVEFGATPSGGIVTMDYAPLGTPSAVDYLTRVHDATPLELFVALAPDQPVPVELERSHRIELAARGLEPAGPRSFDLDVALTDTQWVWYYAADCSADGSWFDNFWDTYNWNWHWYHSTSAWGDYAPGVGTKNLQAHLCNNSNANTTKVFRIMESGQNGACAGGGIWHYVVVGDVAPQYRRQFRVTNNPISCGYDVEGFTKYGSPGAPNWRLGVTKP